MYKGLRDWCFLPVEIHRKGTTAVNGDKLPGDIVNAFCYIADDIENITDKNGINYTSRMQLFFSEDTLLTDSDRLLYDGKTYDIRRLAKYYDGNTKALSIQVAYL